MKALCAWYAVLAAVLVVEAIANAIGNDGPLIPHMTSGPFLAYGTYPGRYASFYGLSAIAFLIVAAYEGGKR